MFCYSQIRGTIVQSGHYNRENRLSYVMFPTFYADIFILLCMSKNPNNKNTTRLRQPQLT
uniref:Uncharacterized protein n=1 Tax=Anguilla anguilla TaxID=7936 RepID=A0A0E9QA92_ANGAN